MQILLTFLVLLCVCVSATAQHGQLVFHTIITGSVDAPVDFMGDAPTGMKAQLYLVDSSGSVTPLNPFTTFRTSNPRAFRYVNGIDVSVPSVMPGQSVTVRMVAYNGTDFESSSFRGYSEELTIPSIGGNTLPPSSLIGLKGFSILPASDATLLAVKGSPGTLWAGPGSTGGTTSGTTGTTDGSSTGGTDGTSTTGGTDGTSTTGGPGGTTGITTGSTDGSSSAGTTGNTDGSTTGADGGNTTGTTLPDLAPDVLAADTLWQIAIASGPYAQTNYPVLFSGGSLGTFQNGNWTGQYIYTKTAPDAATLSLTYINSAGLSSEEMKIAFTTTSTGTILASQTFSANGTATLYENVNATLVNRGVVGTTGTTTGSITTGITTGGTDGGATNGETTAGTTGGQKGQIYFNNRVGSVVDAPIDFMGANPVGMKAQVYWLGPAGAFIPLAPTTTFRTNSPAASRYVVPIDIVLGNIAPMTFITLRVVAFSGDAFDTSQFRGYSDEFSISEVGGGMMPPSNLIGLKGFSILPATEATMVAVKGSSGTLFNGPGSTGGDPGGTNGGTNGNTDGGSTGITTGGTNGSTTGTLPGFAPEQIFTNTHFGILVTGGAFINSASNVRLSGGNSGSFYIDGSNASSGAYTYLRTGTNTGTLTFDFGGGTRGGKDVMHIVFAHASEAVFTGVQSIIVAGGAILERTDLTGKIYNWNPANADGTTGGTTGGTNTGTTGSTTGNTLPTSAPIEIAPQSVIGVTVQSGPYAGSMYEVILSGGSSGTFLISTGAAGHGTYTYYRQSDSSATLTLDYASPVAGERDTMQITFGWTGTISFTGAQKIDGGAGEFVLRTDFAGKITSWSGASGGTTGGTDGGTTSTNGGTSGGGTTGSLPATAPADIPPNTIIRFGVEGGAFSGSLYDVIFTGGSSGTFNIITGSSAHGTYTYQRQSDTSATLTMNYLGPVPGERDTMNIVFGPSTLLRFTGSQRVDTGNGTFIERSDFSGRINQWFVGSTGTTGGTDGGTIGGLDSGTTAGTTGGVTGGTTTQTNGGTTATSSGGDTAGTSSGSTTSGTTGGSLEVPPNSSLRVNVTAGVFAGSSYDIVLSGGNIGTFNIQAGASGNGTYSFTSDGGSSGRLVLSYSNPIVGEIDTMNFLITGQSTGTFTGSQRVDGGGGVFSERNDFAGQITNISGFQFIPHGGNTGGTTAGNTTGTIGGTTAGTDGGITGGTDGATTGTSTGETNAGTTVGTTAGTTSGTNGGTTAASTGGTNAGTTDGTTGGGTTGGDSGSTAGDPGTTSGTTGSTTNITLILKPGFNLVASHVFTGENTISNLFKSLPNGSMIHKYDGTAFNIATKNEEFTPTSAAQMLVQPGEGVFVMNPTSADITLSILGQIPQGVFSNPLPAGLSIRSSMTLRGGTVAELGIPMQDGDQIFTFDPSTQRYKTWTFDTLEGQPGQFVPAPGPILKLGESFFIRKGASAVWNQTFQVTP